MSTADNMAKKIGDVIRSLIDALTNDGDRDFSEKNKTDWQITEAKARSARNLALLRRRMARFEKTTPSQKKSDREN